MVRADFYCSTGSLVILNSFRRPTPGWSQRSRVCRAIYWGHSTWPRYHLKVVRLGTEAPILAEILGGASDMTRPSLT